MHNFCTKYRKILDICKQYSKNLVNEFGNIPRRGVFTKFSDLEVIALSLTAEAMSINSENCLFVRLQTCKNEFPNLISRHQYNIRRKLTKNLCNSIRECIANKIDSTESYFCIDSKPIEVYRKSRVSRCKLGKQKYDTAPSFGYCASQNTYYYGYKLHQFVVLAVLFISMILQKLMYMI